MITGRCRAMGAGSWAAVVAGLAVAGVAAAVPPQPVVGGAAACDVVVYGGASGAITAAVQAARMGRSVIVVSPDRHLGGLSSGGLGMTDTGDKDVIGGLAREFYHRVWRHYERPEAWRWQERSAYGNRGQGTPAIDGAARTMWIFEPHVAERIFEELVAEHGIEVVRDEWLDREQGVRKVGPRIESITTLSGRTYAGRIFIDATYEGDLMAAAGVEYHVGREANAVYGEEHNGVQVGVLHHDHHFGRVPEPISPYRVPGDPTSGVLPRISIEPPGTCGAGDHRVQAYCFRTCFTTVPANRVPFPKPAGYDPGQYELLARIFAAGWRDFFGKFDPIPNAKTDTNNHGPFSFDNIGFNYDYPEASYERRQEIIEEHRAYQQGLLWFASHDPRVPAEVRAELGRWGLAADEFRDNGHWPHQLYVREARRMVGSFVMTEGELRKSRPTPDSVGMGSYSIDSHNVQRYVTPEGHVQNEGDIGVDTGGPYAIAYGALVPKRDQCDNLLVPVCVSASHIAYGSIRMEPVFMILGQSAATAASLAIEGDLAVQDVPYEPLRDRLLADGQVLEHAAVPRAGGGVRTAHGETPSSAAVEPPPPLQAEILETKRILPEGQPYAGWSTVARSREGRLWLVWSGGREAHVCPFGQVHAMTSNDDGATWTWPRVLLDGAIDDRDAGVVETARGTLLVTTFTSLAYEQPLAGIAADDPRRVRWLGVHERLDAAGRRAELGAWLIRSTDGGATWSPRLPTIVNSPHGPIQLADGRLLYAGKELWTGTGRIGVCESIDDGLTWRWLAEIPTRPGDDVKRDYHELHAVETDDGRIVVQIRNHNEPHAMETLQSESADGGRTWSEPRSIGVWGLPSHLLKLRDGRLVMTYGHRRPPFGNQARVSTDHGRTWGAPLTVSADGTSRDLGYPSTVELADGRLLTVWYEKLAPGSATLRQAIWRLTGGPGVSD